MVDYTDHNEVVRCFERAQERDDEVRMRAREAIRFVEQPDGQWEQAVIEVFDRFKRPRYQIDETTPVVNQIAARVVDNDFGIKVEPLGDGADDDKAEIIAGITRDIEARSNASEIYAYSTVEVVKCGFSAWRVTHDYIDDVSFDQEMRIDQIYGAIDRVWFDPSALKQDKSDAKYCFVVNSMSKDEFEAKYPDQDAASVDQDMYYARRTMTHDDLIYVGQLYYIVESEENLVKLEGETGEPIIAVMSPKEKRRYIDAGYTLVNERPIKANKCYSRLFSPYGWLTEPEETIFSTIPVVPMYANYAIVDNEQLYRGVVENLMDPQRILNYTKSEEVSQSALAARPKPWLTPTQAEGFETSLAALNVSNAPYQLYNPDPEAPGVPQMQNPSTVNPNLSQLSLSMSEAITKVSGQFAASMGDTATAKHSGYAIDKLQQAGDLGTVKFTKSRTVAMCRTFQLIVEGIPKVIDTEREVRTRNEDGTVETQTVNSDDGYDVTKGRYDVTCEVGPSYKNKQQETVAGMMEMSKYAPSIQEFGSDILVSNVNSPGMKDISERLRVKMIQGGIIPPNQWTDEEKQQMAQAQQAAAQNQQPDPAMILAQAEMTKGQADMLKAKNEQAKIMLQAQGKDADVEMKTQKQKFDALMAQEELRYAQLKDEYQRDLDAGKLSIEQAQAQANIVNTQANTLKLLSEAMQEPELKDESRGLANRQ